MDEYLFNCYLNWQRERYGNIFKQLHKMGSVMRIILITNCILMLSAVVFVVLESTGIIAANCSLLIMIISMILFIILKIYTDHYIIKNSLHILTATRNTANHLKIGYLNMVLKTRSLF